MGDRCTVTISLQKKNLSKEVEKCFLDNGADFYEERKDKGIVYYLFYDANYAEAGVEEFLNDAGIPYDKEWTSGDEYSAGCEYVRSDGTKTFYGEEMRLISLEDALKAQAEGRIEAFLMEAVAYRQITPLEKC